MNVAGSLRVPGDKSISHRALMLSALAEGRSRVTGILESADVQSTATVLRALGASIPNLSGDMEIVGLGRRGLRAAAEPLDCGNSGTTTRLTAGIVAGYPFTSRFVGDESLSRRPMRRIARPLDAMGAHVELAEHGGLPMTVRGGELKDLSWRTEVPSAQVKSALLLAATVAGVGVVVDESAKTRDHTERMLAARGIAVVINGRRVELARADHRLAGVDTAVPSDPSSAAFFAALASLADGGSLDLVDVCINPTRTGFLDTLKNMGGNVEYADRLSSGGEWVASITVRPARLCGVRIVAEQVPAMIDELPLLACVAACAKGDTVISGASELRVKESDRIAAVVENLRNVGVVAEELPDGMRIAGCHRPLRGSVRTYGDHRLAMAFGVLGALSDNEIRIDDPGCVSVSYPAFWSDLERVRRR